MLGRSNPLGGVFSLSRKRERGSDKPPPASRAPPFKKGAFEQYCCAYDAENKNGLMLLR